MSEKSFPPPVPSSRRKLGMLVLVVVIGLGMAGLAWFSRGDRPSPDTSNNAETEKDEQEIIAVFQKRLDAMENCDIETAHALTTKKSEEILRSTCSNMAKERKCYAGRESHVEMSGHEAVLYFDTYNHDEGWPLFFQYEDGGWKIDFYRMSSGIAMVGDGCDTGWTWRDEKTKNYFCSFFRPGECPEDGL